MDKSHVMFSNENAFYILDPRDRYGTLFYMSIVAYKSQLEMIANAPSGAKAAADPTNEVSATFVFCPTSDRI